MKAQRLLRMLRTARDDRGAAVLSVRVDRATYERASRALPDWLCRWWSGRLYVLEMLSDRPGEAWQTARTCAALLRWARRAGVSFWGLAPYPRERRSSTERTT